MKCRHCGADVTLSFVDLGTAPPSNAYLSREMLNAPDKWYPLRVLTCEECWLVQTNDVAHFAELFSSDYAYFSSYSTTWLKHSEDYVAEMVQRYGLGPASFHIEVAANDGYLLQYSKARGIPCLGIEPTAGTAGAARSKGIEIVEEFFNTKVAERLVSADRHADLMTANNVLAHVPDINDFLAGFSMLLKPAGVATFEFPHLLNLVDRNEFDTVYHEHFSYFSLCALRRIFESAGLSIFDVEELPTHGGSLRLFAQRRETGRRLGTGRVENVIAREIGAGLEKAEYYKSFQEKADKVKNDLLRFLLDAKSKGRRVSGYGAAAKGNTLINYAGIRQDLIPFVADKSPRKQGKYLPGSRIPIVDESVLRAYKPDFVVVFPWNLEEEITEQLLYIREWGGRFVVAVPALEIR